VEGGEPREGDRVPPSLRRASATWGRLIRAEAGPSFKGPFGAVRVATEGIRRAGAEGDGRHGRNAHFGL
jgi:hypothetical protein